MNKVCKQCSQQFEITPSDLAFYEKVSPVFNGKKEMIPPPTLCPECRQQRRLVWQNIFHLYHRLCDATGEKIISNYAPGTPYKVYHNTYWWSDQWDPLDYGRDVDFSKPFFPQFAALLHDVPFPNLSVTYSTIENCEYMNFAGDCKNCYLIAHANFAEDCMFGFGVKQCKDCVDCVNVFNSELLFQCVDCRRCYNVQYAQDCEGCSESSFLRNCLDCKNCFGCMNLRRKEYCIFNEQVSKDAYERFVRSFQSGQYLTVAAMMEKWRAFQLQQVHLYAQGYQNENVTGDHIFRSQNIESSFDIQESRDMKFCHRIYNGPNADCYDVDQYGFQIERVYECSIIGRGAQNTQFCAVSRHEISDLLYCHQCFFSQHLFGCIGLRHKQYCILNKQYSKDEYEQLVPKIIEKMRAEGEWGEFFPVALSPFSYNETVAQEYFPLAKEEVLKRGWKWRDETDEMPKVSKVIPASQLPDSIDDIPDLSSVASAKEDDILQWAIECEATKRPFKIIKQELEFYRKMRLPVPRFHPDERHRRRMALRNPRKLWKRNCMKCQKMMETTYAPDRPEVVYCESCYLKEVY